MRSAFAGLMGSTKCAPCSRCDGTGRIQRFNWYANGVCFWCKGTGCEPKDPPKRRGYTPETSPIEKKEWKPRDGSESVQFIKNWLRQTFKSAGGYDSFEDEGDFEKQRWYQIAQQLAYLRMAADSTLYPRAVKRAFEYAKASKWKKAADTLDMNLSTAIQAIQLHWDVPGHVAWDVPDVFSYGP